MTMAEYLTVERRTQRGNGLTVRWRGRHKGTHLIGTSGFACDYLHAEDGHSHLLATEKTVL
jgi:hypothetical protein